MENKKLHGLSWDLIDNDDDNSNYLAIENLYSFIKSAIRPFELVYVKGLQKRKWLLNIIPNNKIVDLLDLGCSKLDSLTTTLDHLHCKNHIFNNLKCVQNVYILGNWFRNNERMRMLKN